MVIAITATQCPIGTISNSNNSACVACPVGTLANNIKGATECVSVCPNGYGINAGHSSASSSKSACGECNDGYYQQGGSAECMACNRYQSTDGTGASSYESCEFPRQSFWMDLQTSSGRYFPCSAVCIGLSDAAAGVIALALAVVVLILYAWAKPPVNTNKKEHSAYNTLVVLLFYCTIPVLDYLSDVAYLLTAQYYNYILFWLSVAAILGPAIVFARRLRFKGIKAKFWILPMPSCLFYEEYDSIFKIMFTFVLAIPFILINSPVLIPEIIVGIFLQATKVLAISRVSNVWYYILTGDESHACADIVDTQVLNEAIFTNIAYKTLLHIGVQVVNNTLMNRWTIFAKISIVCSGLNTLNGLYQVLYFKLYKRINIIDIPLRVTFFGLLVEPYEIEPTKHSNNISKDFSITEIFDDMNLRTSKQSLTGVSIHRNSSVEMRSSSMFQQSSISKTNVVILNPINKNGETNDDNTTEI